MGNQPESRRKSKRIAAAAVYDEQDGDFLFTRGSKRQKTTEKTAAAKDVPPPKSPEPAPANVVKKARGRPSNGKKRASSPPPPQKGQAATPTIQTSAPKRSTRRKPDSSPPVPEREKEEEVMPKKRAGRKTRNSTEKAAEDEQDGEEPPAAATGVSRTNGAKSAKNDGGARKTSGRSSRKKQPAAPPPPPVAEREDEDEDEDDAIQATPEYDNAVDTPLEKDPNATKIALPFSDTPINNRNKEFRKKGGGGAGAGGGRRSSMSMRGRRASSLIENGQSAIPHKEVAADQFFKHIEAEGLSEPRRMKQLLTWCGERALSEKPKHGSTNGAAVHGARAIQDSLLKDFGSKSEFSDWFSREDEPSAAAQPKRKVTIEPNPINVEHEQKIAALEARIKRLKETRKSWRALQKPLPQVEPLYPPDSDPKAAPLPETSLLDAEELQMLESLTDPSSSFAHLTSSTRSRLQAVQSAVEFKVDRLADSVHKMDLRVTTAGRQADKVLALSSERLKERETREREAAGTKEMPVMEVLRSLGRILPENGGPT